MSLYQSSSESLPFTLHNFFVLLNASLVGFDWFSETVFLEISTFFCFWSWGVKYSSFREDKMNQIKLEIHLKLVNKTLPVYSVFPSSCRSHRSSCKFPLYAWRKDGLWEQKVASAILPLFAWCPAAKTFAKGLWKSACLHENTPPCQTTNTLLLLFP